MARRSTHPEDSHRGAVTVAPRDTAEAAADREMAEAEREVALGAASEQQRARLLACSEVRTHEERRRVWMDAAPQTGDQRR